LLTAADACTPLDPDDLNRLATAAFLAISTRYAMLAAEPSEHLLRRFRTAGLHIRQSPLNPFDCLDAIAERPDSV
jgi:hypothetical protein